MATKRFQNGNILLRTTSVVRCFLRIVSMFVPSLPGIQETKQRRNKHGGNTVQYRNCPGCLKRLQTILLTFCKSYISIRPGKITVFKIMVVPNTRYENVVYTGSTIWNYFLYI